MIREISLLLLGACVLSAQERQIGRGVNFYSMEKEQALGEQLAKEVERQVTLVEIRAVQEYLGDLTRRLAMQLPAGFAFTVAVIHDDGGYEPMSLPGGFIFVRTSLILAAQNEAEFVGMLAHAMAHIAARHSTRMAARASIANQATIPLIYIGGSTGYGIRQAASVLIPMGFRQFARANELEADRIAVSVAADSGFDPRAMLAFTERTYKDERPTRIESALPPRDQRLAALRQAIDELPARAYEPREGFEKIQEALRAAGIK